MKNKKIIDLYALQKSWDPDNTMIDAIAMLSPSQMSDIATCIQGSAAAMSPMERTVLQARIDGHPTGMIAQRLGVDRSYVSRLYHAAADKVDFSRLED